MSGEDESAVFKDNTKLRVQSDRACKLHGGSSDVTSVGRARRMRMLVGKDESAVSSLSWKHEV